MRNHLFFTVLILTFAFGSSSAFAEDKSGPLFFAIGVGTSVPLGADVTSVSKAGVHLSGGGYFEIYNRIYAGLHISYDLPSSQKLPNGVDPEAQFTGIQVRGMYLAQAGITKPWVSLGFGLFRNRLSKCESNSCTIEDQSQAGLDVSAGLDVPVYNSLTAGLDVGITAPAFGAFTEQLLMHGGVRFTFSM